MNALWIAMGFLTRFPSKLADFNPADAARSVFWFPAIGLLVGALVWSSVRMTSPLLGKDLAALLGLALWVWITGALHLDGLADTFDGFSASGGGTTRALQAMKDSRIGAHGACALILLLLAKWVLLRRCIELGAIEPAIVGAAMSARLGAGFVLAWAKPASATGLGALFSQELRTRRGKFVPWISSSWGLVLVGCLWWLPHVARQTAAQSIGLSFIVVAAVLFVFVKRCQACFGGVTGDTHGAAIELTEVLVMAVHVAVFGMANA